MAVSAVQTPPKVESKSQHTVDNSVQPFLQPDFDPADYLNSTLPALNVSSLATRSSRAVPLSELSSQLQTLLSQLNAQTTRLSTALTQLTDEIIRSGSRLAYEVEVLRGETLGLTDALDSGLKKDIELLAKPAEATDDAAGGATNGQAVEDGSAAKLDTTPADFLERLRTLTAVRDRLELVIKTFGSAMQWPVAPSELTATSSLISVSAPEKDEDVASREQKGQQYAEDLRTEMNGLLSSGLDGLDAAVARVEELRELAEVWKGTVEEKARMKVVEGLQKLVDERQKSLERAAEEASRRPGVTAARGHDYRSGSSEAPRITADSGSGYGFLQNLRNLKSEVYID